jgi:alpha-N-arabinofuranosidase
MRQQLGSFAEMEKAILQLHALLRSYDPEGRIGLLIDEWGIWDRMNPEEEKRYGRLWQQIPMRGALAAAMGLNVFHRQADKLIMGNIAQTVNVLHSMLLTDGPHCIRTPAYYAFEFAKPHRGKTALRFESDEKDPAGLSVSVSREGGELIVTCVNPRPDETLRVECVLAGATAARATARLLHHPDLNACNTFERPDTIVPRDHPVGMTRDTARLELPPLAVATAILHL